MTYFEQKGYTCTASEWPYRNQSVAELNKNTPPELAQIGAKELTDHYERIIRAMDEPPFLIGHSFGGLIVQQLLDRGVGRAGVALDSVAPEGVLALDWSVLKANSSVLFKWAGWEKVQTMTLAEFEYAFANILSEEEQKFYYDRFVVQHSGRIFFQIAFAQLDPHHAIRVNFKNNERAPLLLIAGEHDQLVPAHISMSNYEHYKHSEARTDFYEFLGRTHLLMAQDNWEEVAEYIANWFDRVSSDTVEYLLQPQRN